MKIIPLTKGKFTIVDDEDFEFLSQREWCYTSNGYAMSDGVLMHRLLMGEPPCDVDHRSRDRLDNRHLNLRLASKSQTQWNKGRQKNNTSGFKGVFWDPRKARWYARIQAYGKRVRLGFFDCAQDAADAYAEAAKEKHGEFASP